MGTEKSPSNWQSFLRDANNKQELFHLIADKVEGIKTANEVIVTKGIMLSAITPQTWME